MSSLLLSLLSLLSIARVVSSSSSTVVTCTYYQAALRRNSTESLLHLCRIHQTDYLLPAAFTAELDSLQLESGAVRLELGGVYANDVTSTIDISSNGDDEPLMYSLEPDEREHLSVSRTKGERTVLVVRVNARSGQQTPSFSRQELSNNVFGDPTRPGRASFARQYDLCSQGELNFVPAVVTDEFQDNDSGVVDLTMDADLRGADFTLAVETALSNAFLDRFDASEHTTFDHIMFCLPAGMNQEFIAFAVLNDKLSFYSDPWCGMMSASMHEIGHNIGMRELMDVMGCNYT